MGTAVFELADLSLRPRDDFKSLIFNETTPKNRSIPETKVVICRHKLVKTLTNPWKQQLKRFIDISRQMARQVHFTRPGHTGSNSSFGHDFKNCNGEIYLFRAGDKVSVPCGSAPERTGGVIVSGRESAPPYSRLTIGAGGSRH